MIQQLTQMLGQIQTLLEQVQQITENQRNILIQQETEDTGIDIIEQMAKYKEDLTTEIEQVESKFENLYTQEKGTILGTVYTKEIRSNVEAILKLKEKVIQLEEENVRLLKERLKVHAKPQRITPQANQVAAAYKVHDAYRNGNN